MARQLRASDLLIEQNKDGNFFYIKPDTGRFGATDLILDHESNVMGDGFGLRVNELDPQRDAVQMENVSTGQTTRGLGLVSTSKAFVYDFTFFKVVPTDVYGSAIFRAPTHSGQGQFLRVYGNGEDTPMKDGSGYATRNTDFLDDGGKYGDVGNALMFRDITAANFHDGGFDTKGTVYIMNATIENCYRLLRTHANAKIYIVNSDLRLGDGKEYAQLFGTSARIYYYNTTWDGAPHPDLSKIGVTNANPSRWDNIRKNNLIALDHNPLPGLSDFFKLDTSRYIAQISVNGDAWKPLALPNDGWLGSHIGDTLVTLPDLGNGVYRIRAWTADGSPTTPTMTQSFLVNNAGFDYVGGFPIGSPQNPLPLPAAPDATLGTSGHDRLKGDSRDDAISAGAGADTISGGGGRDTLRGDGGADLLHGGGGDDRLFGGPGNDTLLGGQGDDTLTGGAGTDLVDGGAGFDIVSFLEDNFTTGGYRIDMLAGTLATRAAPTVVVERFVDISGVIGSTGNDVVIGDNHANRFDGGPGNDTITGGGGSDVYLFDNTRDIGWDVVTDFSFHREIWLTRFSNLGPDGVAPLDAGGFWIQVAGMTGGGPLGHRRVDLGYDGRWMKYEGQNSEGYFIYKLLPTTPPKIDLLPGADKIDPPPNATPTSGPDTLTFGPTSDDIRGFDGDDSLWAGAGDDTAFGDAGNDLTRGEDDNDRLFGGGNNDTLHGDAGHDRLLGGPGDDWLLGGDGADTLDGGDGKDTLAGGAGDDMLVGQAGADAFLFDNATPIGADTIADFGAFDAIWLSVRAETTGNITLRGVGHFDLGPADASILILNPLTMSLRYAGVTGEGLHVYQYDL